LIGDTTVLANALPTIAWACLALGLTSQVLWLATDGRRPDMPREIYHCMAGIIGQLLAGLLIAGLALQAPLYVHDALFLAGVISIHAVTYSDPAPRDDEPCYPMTAGWQMAARRFFLRSRLCMTAGATFGILTAVESPAIWGLGAVAAANLFYYRRKTSWYLWLPLLFSAFTLFAALYLTSVLRAGAMWSLADIQVHVLASIPGDDAVTITLLKGYLAIILLLFLAAVILDMGADLLRLGSTARVLMRVGLTWVRLGSMLAFLMMLRPLQQPTASAWIVCGALILTELLVFFIPSPEPEVDAAPARADNAVLPA
jgi:hypothetical protein